MLDMVICVIKFIRDHSSYLRQPVVIDSLREVIRADSYSRTLWPTSHVLITQISGQGPTTLTSH